MKGIARKTLALLRRREQKAIETANRAAEAAGCRVTDYRKPKATFYSISIKGGWSVYYVPRVRSQRTACFWIEVDAATGATKFIANK